MSLTAQKSRRKAEVLANTFEVIWVTLLDIDPAALGGGGQKQLSARRRKTASRKPLLGVLKPTSWAGTIATSVLRRHIPWLCRARARSLKRVLQKKPPAVRAKHLGW